MILNSTKPSARQLTRAPKRHLPRKDAESALDFVDPGAYYHGRRRKAYAFIKFSDEVIILALDPPGGGGA